MRTTGDAADAIRGSDFVVCQLRVGGQAARHRDELLGREFGLVGQETTGVGGFAKALRTIPVMLEIAAVVEREAPGATFVNFTNPAGLITELLRRHTSLRVIGLCNVPWNMRVDLAAVLGVAVERVELDYVGLNHLSWVRALRVDGEDRTAEMLARARGDAGLRGGGADDPGFSPATLALLGMLPSYYCRYFYETAAMLRQQEQHPTRASEVMEIERRLLRRYEDPLLREKPPELMERGGAYYSESAAALMADVWSDAGSVQVVNVRNDGALPGLPDDVVIEAPARIGRDGAVALATAPLARGRRRARTRRQGLRAADDRGGAERRPAARAARADHEPARPGTRRRAARLGAAASRQPGAARSARCLSRSWPSGSTAAARRPMPSSATRPAPSSASARRAGATGSTTASRSRRRRSARPSPWRFAAAGVAPAQIASSVFALAGLDWPVDVERLAPVVAGFGLGGPCELVNDAFAALRAGCRHRHGVVSVAGTGSVTAGRNRRAPRSGRWRSGTASAAEGPISSTRRSTPSHGPGTARLRTRCSRIASSKRSGSRRADALFQAITRDGLEVSSELAPLVLGAAADGDPAAIAIAHEMGAALATAVVGVARTLEMEAEVFEVVCAGGVHGAASAPLASAFRETLGAGCPLAVPFMLTAPPAIGAAMLALERLAVVDEAMHDRLLAAPARG